jgi:hypothetical protein
VQNSCVKPDLEMYVFGDPGSKSGSRSFQQANKGQGSTTLVKNEQLKKENSFVGEEEGVLAASFATL